LNRRTACALTILAAVLLPVSSFARQAPSAAKPDAAANAPGTSAVDEVAIAREALGKAERAHPENTIEVLKAMDDLVAAQIDTFVVSDETLTLVNRELQVSETVGGPRSKEFVNALDIKWRSSSR
jgi:hypothetical protein